MIRPFFSKHGKAIIMGISGVWFSFTVLRKDAEITNIQSEKEKLIEEVGRIRSTITQLVYTVSNSSADLDLVPIPMWFKIYDRDENDFKMVFINRAFEVKYDVTREYYIGEQDKIVWGDTISRIFRQNDERAFYSRNPVWALEPDRKGREFPILKWRVDRGTRIFIYGMELPDAEYIGKYGYKMKE